MGRVSMPMINKSGYSMYWNSMWDDKLNYSRSLKEDLFIKIFMRIFFEGGAKTANIVDLKNFEKKFKYFKKNYNFQVKKIIRKNEIGETTGFRYAVKNKNKFRPFLTKIWVLRYQTWVVIYFYSYIFSLSIFFKKKRRNNTAYKKYSNLILNYYKNVNRIKYNYFLYKKSFLKDVF